MRRAYLTASAASAAALVMASPACLPARADTPPPAGLRTSTEPTPPDCPAGAPVARDFARDTSICVKPLDDPANPYRGRYSAVDVWTMQHAVSPTDGASADAAFRKIPEGAVLTQPWPAETVLTVDMDGWLVPFVEFQQRIRSGFYSAPTLPVSAAGLTVRQYQASVQQRMEEQQSRVEELSQQPPQPSGMPPYMLIARGEMPPEVYAEWERHFHGWQSGQYPPVPAWLGENPPLAAVFLPDGSILAYGPLGLHYSMEKNQAQPWETADSEGLNRGGEDWYRYSTDGKLLEQRKASAAPHYWMESWSGKKEAGRGGNSNIYPGFVVKTRYPTGSGVQSTNDLLAAYLWDGTPLDLDAPAPDFPAGVGQLVPRSTLLPVYRAQLATGRTTRESLSPYSGTPEGPVTVDPTPRPLPVVSRGPGRMTTLKPLDDPANPYRGQYSEWDRWVFEHADALNPEEQAYYTQQMEDHRARRDEARKARLPEPEMDIQAYRPAPDSLWRTVHARMDADGWLIPLAQTPPSTLFLERDYRAVGNWLRSEGYVTARGELPPAAWAEVQALQQAARKAAYARAFPPLPEWLKNRPVEQVIFLPDGSVITTCGPGSYEPASAVDPAAPPEARKPGRIKGVPRYYRYSASGELLGEYEYGREHGWLPLTWPMASQVATIARLVNNQDVQFSDGYLLVYAGPAHVEKQTGSGQTIMVTADPPPALVAAYDWDGTPLDITQPLTRADGYCVAVRWEDIGE